MVRSSFFKIGIGYNILFLILLDVAYKYLL